ncbi:MAG TPA: hypothetical protein VJX68_18040 [Candidatus Binatus sp.]|uniref:hypothetical protein n=1 Tax=Candidatus Binatus sp. TaxID=2811406 RepID=UPI002B483D9F|nr:hypothetical protein [Candidatus Binatus sp.]HKN15094.1 hypothetical protein [Candidatus Binatus sp.]
MAKANDQIVVCTYRVKAGREKDFIELLKRHWPTLRKLGLVNEQPRMALQGRDTDKTSCFVEVFAWKDRGFEGAHKHPKYSRCGSRWNRCARRGTAIPRQNFRTMPASRCDFARRLRNPAD